VEIEYISEFNQWVETFRRANNGYLPSPLEVYEHLQANPHLLKEDENELNTDFVPPLEIKKTINKKVVINKIFKEKENNHSEDFYKGSVPKMPNHPPMPPHKIESKEYRPMYESDCNSAEDFSVVIRDLVVILILGLVVMGLIKNL
jgi:hypothetical protein